MLKVGGKEIGAGAPCFIVAEIGMNHNGDPALAGAMIEKAAACGADAVKFQVFCAEAFVTRDALVYGDGKAGQPKSQIEMLRPLELSAEVWRQLKERAEDRGLVFFATPLDESSVEVLEGLDVGLMKIASCDTTNIPLIRKVAGLKRPTLMSTGMSDVGDIATGVSTFLATGNRQLALLQCTSSYPARPEDAHVRAIPVLRETFGVPVGFSDHCRSNYAAFAAVALGASVVEKHFTTDNALPGVDQEMSLNPEAFTDLVRGVRAVESSLGCPQKRVLPAEEAALQNGRRGIVARGFIPAGTVIAGEMLTTKRPALGISAAHYDLVVGRRARKDLREDEHITWDCI